MMSNLNQDAKKNETKSHIDGKKEEKKCQKQKKGGEARDVERWSAVAQMGFYRGSGQRRRD